MLPQTLIISQIGKWYEYIKKEGKIFLEVRKEVFENKLEHACITYRDNYIITEYFKAGFSVGLHTCVSRNKNILLNETLYVDSFNYCRHIKSFDIKTGKLLDYYDFRTLTFYKYFPNGNIEAKCPIDKYSSLHGKMEIFDKKGKLIRTVEYKNNELIE